jgi:hypothetical protein
VTLNRDFQLESVHCANCGRFWLLPASLDAAARAEIAALARRQLHITGVKRLRAQTHLSLLEAKAVVGHISRAPGVCHWCGDRLEGGEICVCSTCGSLNYDW